jgi:hypothetical protein
MIALVMIATVVVTAIAVSMVIRTALGLERRLDDVEPRTQLRQHLFEHVVATDAQAIAHDLHLGVAVAEMPGEPRKIVRRRRRNLDQRLGTTDHAHDPAIVEHEAVAVVQHGRPRQIEQERRAAFARQYGAPAMPLIGIERNLIDVTCAPLTGWLDGDDPRHDSSSQNKKYRCAIGSTSAGAQVMSSPSAVTS